MPLFSFLNFPNRLEGTAFVLESVHLQKYRETASPISTLSDNNTVFSSSFISFSLICCDVFFLLHSSKTWYPAWLMFPRLLQLIVLISWYFSPNLLPRKCNSSSFVTCFDTFRSKSESRKFLCALVMENSNLKNMFKDQSHVKSWVFKLHMNSKQENVCICCTFTTQKKKSNKFKPTVWCRMCTFSQILAKLPHTWYMFVHILCFCNRNFISSFRMNVTQLMSLTQAQK